MIEKNLADVKELVPHEFKECYPFNDTFKVVPQLNAQLTDHIVKFNLNMANNIIELTIDETKEFSVLDWVAGLAQGDSEEILTFISAGPKNLILCMLRFSKLSLLDHEVGFLSSTPAMRVRHEVQIQYEAMERINTDRKGRIIGDQ